ncbi:MAG: alpha-(1-_3)-arabinofuranosyltransferase domain-containing protein, partial [Gaiellales bacterium]
FNPFTVTSWAVGHNVQFLAYACAPLWLAKLLDVWRGPRSLTSGLGPALVSLLFASAFNNPSIIFTMIVLPATVVGTVMMLNRTVRPGKLLLGTGSVLLWVLLLHAWWWFPMASSLLSAGGYEYAGASWNLLDYPGIATGVPSGEFLRGLGFWEMYSSHHGEPYFPWSASYSHPILVLATIWLVALAFVPALFRRRARGWAVVAALFALVGIFFSKGVNPPLGEVNMWLFENVPGFYLFRGTYEKFAPLTFLGIAIGLAALILHRAPRSRLRSYVTLGTLGAVLLGGWPLFTGDVASTLTGLGVNPNVRIPAYYRAFEAWTREGAESSVLVVPQSPIGYVKTTWGYSGHDLIQNYSSRPVVMGWPEARPKDGPRFRAFLSLADSYDRPALLQRHGIGHVLVRYDMDPGFYEGTPGPRVVEARLRRQGFVFERTIGRFQIYRSPLAVSPVQAHSEVLGRQAGADGESSSMIEATSAAGTDALTTSRAPTWCAPSPVSVDPSGEWLEADCPIEGRVQARPLPPYRFSFEAASRGGHVRIALDPAATVVEAGGSLVDIGPSGFDVELDAGDLGGAIRLGDALIPVTRGPGYSAGGSLLLEPGTPAQILRAGQDNLLEDGSFEETLWSGAYDLDGRRTGEIAILQSSDATDGAFSMELHAEGEEAFASRRLTGSMDPRASYLLSFDYRSVEGGPAGFAVWEEGGGGYATQDLRLEPSREWRHVEVAVDPSPRAQGLEVFLYTLASPGEVTINRFDDVRLRELLPSTDVALPEIRVAPELSVTLSDGAGVRFPTSGIRRGLLEDGSFEQGLWNGANDKLAGGVQGDALAARPSPDATAGEHSLELAAGRGGVYTSRFVERSDARSVYRLSFDYKNVAGGPAGFGVWEIGTERYSAHELSLPPTTTWKHVERLFAPSEQAGGLELFLY